MPNHIKNRLTIEGEKEIVDFVFRLISNEKENNFIDFNKIIPAPAFCLSHGGIGTNEEQIAEKLNVSTWLKFNRKEWGTKWNAYNQKKIDNSTIEYDTAWSSSAIVIEAIAKKFVQLKITLLFADEYAGANTGKIIWEGDERIIDLPKYPSIQGFENYFELNPENKKHFTLKDGMYEYIEE